MIDDLLVCPVHHTAIRVTEEQKHGKHEIKSGEYTYTIEDGIFDLTPIPPPDALTQKNWYLWEQLQENGLFAYTEDPENNLSVDDRNELAIRFGEFAQLTGTVLDVGCGPQRMPSYGALEGRFVGIDPLRGEQPRDFDFVQSIGEFLPFRDRTFDRVLFATSLDHVLNPVRCLLEAKRVLKPDGRIIIWYGNAGVEHRLVLDEKGDLVPWYGDDPLPEGYTPVGQLSPLERKLRTALKLLRAGDVRRFAGGLSSTLGIERWRNRGSQPSYMKKLEVPDGAIDEFHFFHVDEHLLLHWLAETGLVRVEHRYANGTPNCYVRIRIA
jgi:SAM-dependent methyltransferase